MPTRTHGITRRRLLLGAGAAAGGVVTVAPRASGARRNPAITYPFTLGIASGDPLPDGVVLWTRLAPDPGDPADGMPHRAVPVDWMVARDPGLRSRGGTRVADHRRRHHMELHVETAPNGLRSNCLVERPPPPPGVGPARLCVERFGPASTDTPCVYNACLAVET
jgi:alkaline phosphatase D